MRKLEDFQKERKTILKDIVDDDFFSEFLKFIEHLFGKSIDDKTFEKRVFIFIARKGFSLFHLAVNCGLLGDRLPGPKQLISNRKWRKLTTHQRVEFVRGKDVFIVDDAIISSSKAYEVYVDIDASVCDSRSVVVLSSDNIYRYDLMFQNFKSFIDINVRSFEKRHIQHSKVMKALYTIPIAFTADSPSVYSINLPYDQLQEWMELNGENNGWRCELTPLDFPHSGLCESTFVLHAPIQVASSANVLSQGVRLCYRVYEENESKMVEVYLVPWIIFDIIDYSMAIEYLLRMTEKYVPDFDNENKFALYHHLQKGENDRKRVITHRVFSYIADAYILDLFIKEFGQDLTLNKTALTDGENAYSLEEYHYHEDILDEMHIICDKICISNDPEDSPYSLLCMSKEEHDDARDGLLKSHFDRVDTEDGILAIDELKAKLFGQREWTFDSKKNRPVPPTKGVRHPILFCKDESSGIELLNLIRSAVASFNADIVSYKNKMYLINTLYPGEGNYIPCYGIADFIWGLHHIAHCGYYSIDKDIEQRFGIYWNKNATKRLSTVNNIMLQALKSKSPVYWPQKKIVRNYLNNIEPALMEEAANIADAFIENELHNDQDDLIMPIII